MGGETSAIHTDGAFAERMLDLLNSGALSLMISIGHRTGLFDVMDQMPPAGSAEIAGKAGLNERYVREWLSALAAGGIVDYHADGLRYSLPPGHADFLTRRATPDNIAVFAQYIGQLGAVENRIVDCFRNGGGVAYGEFERFHQIMAEDSGQTVVAALKDHILPLVPGLTASLERGIDVLDVGCGSGRAAVLLAASFPNSRVVGYDFSEEAVAAAAAAADRQGLANIRFEVKDVEKFEEADRYDFITAFDAIHDQARPDKVLSNIALALRPGGVFLMQDIAASSHLANNLHHPIGPLLYTISCMHCMSVSLAQNGMGLGTMWGEEKARAMLQAAGFASIDVRQLPHDFQNNYFIVR